ncbi:MAG: LacI family DNA-binding transcriptional regulator [Rariglobus sp.]
MANKASADSSGSPSASARPPRRVTLRDIAAEIGVTPMTVSRALRNQTRISAEMRDKIQAKAAEMGYQPDPALTALVHYRHNRMDTPIRAALAWVNFWPEPAKLRRFREFDFYWQGAHAAAERLGFHLEEFVFGDEMTPLRLAQILNARNIRGVLIPPGELPERLLKEFPWSQFSVVSISRPAAGLPIHAVTSDQTTNAMLAFRKMRECGYRRIGFVGEAWIGRFFCPGFLWVQQMEVPAELRLPPFLFNDVARDAALDALQRWVDDNKPDAILTENPNLPKMLAKLRKSSVRGLGLAAMTVLDCPINAGIYQNPQEIGRVAVLMLQSLINDNDRGIPAVSRQVLIEGAWVEGSSLPVKRVKVRQGR